MEIKLNDVSSKNLTNINITIHEKEITSLIGANISIKKEFIDLIYGIEKVTSGTIKYGRKKYDATATYKKINELRQNIFFLREEYNNMLFNINIKEDIKFYLEEYNEEQLYELLKSFNLNETILNSNYLDLSSSQIKIILLIIGLMSKSKVLIFDNPSKNLDNKAIQTFVKHLKKLKREEKIILIISYNTNFLLEVSDRIIVFDDKNIIQDGTKFGILSDEKLLNKVNLKVPNVLNFINKVKCKKNIKLSNRDNINDLIKDIFRYAK